MTMRALAAAKQLEADGIDVAVTHVPTIKPLDHTAIARAAGGGRLVVTLENHTIIGGLADAVASSLVFESAAGTLPPLRRIGLPDEFLLAGALPTLHERYGLSTQCHRGRRAEVDRLTALDADRLRVNSRRRLCRRPGTARTSPTGSLLP